MGQDGAASVGGEDEAILDLLPVVRRVVAARMRDPHLVDDLVQETLARMMGARARLEPEALVPYAIVTARNLIASHLERQDRDRRKAHLLADPGGTPTPEDEVLVEERRCVARRGAAAAARAGARPAGRARGGGHRHRDAGRRPRLDPGRDRRAAEPQPGQAAGGGLLADGRPARRRRTGAGRCSSRCPAASAGASGSWTAAGHLLECDYCSALGPALLDRRRGRRRRARCGSGRCGTPTWSTARQKGREIAARAGFSPTEADPGRDRDLRDRPQHRPVRRARRDHGLPGRAGPSGPGS